MDWLKVYLYDNIFLYNSDIKAKIPIGQKFYYAFYNVGYELAYHFYRNLRYSVVLTTGMIASLFLPENKISVHEKRTVFFIAILTTFGIYIGGNSHGYSGFPLSLFFVFGTAILLKAAGNLRQYIPQFSRHTYIFACAITCAISIAVCFTSRNVYLMKVKKTDMPQYQFATLMNKTEHPTMLNYGFLDGGFYTASGIVPNCKYYCSISMPIDIIHKTQYKYLLEKKVDYVVTRKKISDRSILQNYHLIKEAYFIGWPSGEEKTHHYLYQKS